MRIKAEQVRSWVIPLVVAAGIAAIAIPGNLAVRDGRNLIKAQFGVGQREGQKTRDMIERQIAQTRSDLANLINARADTLQTAVLKEVRHGVDTSIDEIGRWRTSTAAEVDTALGEVHEIHAEWKPVADNTAALLATYNALPAQIGAQVRPAWLALQPEFTCRTLDGAGYGGCWHSRITAVLGETARAGGVFAQKFPQFADAATGLVTEVRGTAGDIHAWTDKYVRPHPIHGVMGYVKVGGKLVYGTLVTWSRIGAPR